MPLRARIRTTLLTAAVAVALALMLGDTNAGPDSVNYEAFARSILLHGDVFLGDDLALAGKYVFAGPTGYPIDIHNAGVVLFWAPFYWVAHLFAALTGEANGYGPIYILLLRFADWVYGALALLLMHASVRRHLPDAPAGVAIAAVALGSPFIYYMGVLSPGTHMVSVFLSSLFLYVFADEDDSAAKWIRCGVIGGLALAVANTNIGLVALPLAYFVARRTWRKAMLFGVFYALAFAPQLVLWWLFTGHPLRSPYGGQLSWTHPHLVEILFSSFHGLYFVAPLVVLATLGMFFLRDRRLAFGSLAVLALTAYIGSVNLGWWGGGAFGARYLLGVTPFFALGLAALLARLPRPLGIALVTAGALWTAFLYLPYATHTAVLSRYYPAATQLRQSLASLRLLHVPEISALELLGVPAFTLLVVLAARQPARIVQRIARTRLAALPIILLLLMAVVVLRTQTAKAACNATCRQAWIPADRDLWDLAYTYAERAHYEQAIGDESAARRDLETAARLLPQDAALQLRAR